MNMNTYICTHANVCVCVCVNGEQDDPGERKKSARESAGGWRASTLVCGQFFVRVRVFERERERESQIWMRYVTREHVHTLMNFHIQHNSTKFNQFCIKIQLNSQQNSPKFPTKFPTKFNNFFCIENNLSSRANSVGCGHLWILCAYTYILFLYANVPTLICGYIKFDILVLIHYH